MLVHSCAHMATVGVKGLIYVICEPGYEMDGGNEKKKQDKWKRCAELAITWNCSTIARRTIFNNANYDHWRVRIAHHQHCALQALLLAYLLTYLVVYLLT